MLSFEFDLSSCTWNLRQAWISSTKYKAYHDIDKTIIIKFYNYLSNQTIVKRENVDIVDGNICEYYMAAPDEVRSRGGRSQ